MQRLKFRYILFVLLCAVTVVLIHGYIHMLLMCSGLKEGYAYTDAMRDIDMSDYETDKIFYTDTNKEDTLYIAGLNEGVLRGIVYRKIYMSLHTERAEQNMKTIPVMFKKAVPENVFEEAYNVYAKIYSDIKCFPVPKDMSAGIETPYVDSWNYARDYGGDRKHEGTDIMAANNARGYFPVVSMTDGVVENKGWLELGGWRIGIRSPGGAYYYYAHLADYAEGIEEGTQVKAGTVIGTMGDTGYSKEEGTVGNFDVHLHLGIYCDYNENEISFNPYYILKSAEKSRMEFVP